MWKGALAAVLFAGSAMAEPILAGRVMDASGGAVGGAVVLVVPLPAAWRGVPHAPLPIDAPLASAASADDGTFRIDAAAIPAGLHAIAVTPPGGSPSVLRWHERVAFGGPALPADLELRLPALVDLDGLVLDELGKPVAGAAITATSESRTDVLRLASVTDASGRFALRVPASGTLTAVAAQGDRWGIVRAPIGPETRAVLAVHVAPAELVESQAFSRATGRPVPGVRVRTLLPSWDPAGAELADATIPPWGSAQVVADTMTTEEGRFTARVPPGATAMLTSDAWSASSVRPGRMELLPATPVRVLVVDEAGAPVSGADVRWTEIPDVVRTDASGRCVLTPDVNADVLVTTEDGASRKENVQSVVADLRLALPVLRRVAGSVSADGAPAPGVTVRAAADSFDVLTATDSAGRFELSLRGNPRITASRGGLAASAPAGSSLALALLAAPPAAREPSLKALRVRVTAPSGPLSGALLRAMPMGETEGPIATAATGADGVATLQVRGPEPREVLVIRPGFASQWAHRVAPGTEASVRMEPGSVLAGTVRSEDGAPVGGAIIVAEREAQRSATAMEMPERRAAMSDAAGAFVLRDLASGVHAVDVSAYRFVPPPRTRVTLSAARQASVELVLGAGATLRGFVHDETGPLGGIVVKATPRLQTFSGDSVSRVVGMRGTYTADDGTFAIPGLQGDQWYDLEIVADWHAPATAGGRPSESLVDVVLTSTGAIEGEVEGEADGATVSCEPVPRGEDRSPEFAEIAGGKFSVTGLLPGIYTCSVRADLAAGEVERIDVRPRAATRVTIPMTPLPSITVEVRDAVTGSAIEGASVSSASGSAVTEDDGRAVVALGGSRDDDWDMPDEQDSPEVRERRAEIEAYRARRDRTISASAEGHAEASLELPTPPPKAVTLKLQPLPRIRGRVLDAAGVPAAGAEVSWFGSRPAAVTDADGRFETISLDREDGEGGGLELSARRRTDRVLEVGRADVVEGSDVVIRLQRVELAILTVAVRDAEGPVEGARVTVIGEEAEGLEGVTNAEGRFVSAPLAPGSSTVLVEAEGGLLARKQAMLLEGARLQLDVLLGEGWYVDGKVVRAGRPVEGAQVSWISETGGGFGAAVMTRVDGSFRLGPVDDEVTELRILVMGGVEMARQVRATRGAGPVVIDVGNVTVRGRVVSGEAAVPSARLDVTCGDLAWGSHEVADGEGAFEMRDVPGGEACTLAVGAEGRPTTLVSIRTLAEGSQDLGDVNLASRRIVGHASFPDGVSVAKLSIQLLGPTGRPVDDIEVPVTAGGSFGFDAGEGTAFLLAEAPDSGLAWIREELRPDAPLELAFVQGATLSVAATNSDGTPAEGMVQLLRLDGRALEGMQGGRAWSEDGTALLEGLPSGHASLELATKGGRTAFEADLQPGRTTTVSVVAR